MKVVIKDEREINTAETQLGTITDRGERLYIESKDRKVLIKETEIQITFHVRRPGHDHGGSSTTIIVGKEFVEPDPDYDAYPYAGPPEEIKRIPLIKLPKRFQPDIDNVSQLLNEVLWDLEKQHGKCYFGDIDGGLHVHGYKLAKGSRYKKGIIILAMPEDLKAILKLLNYKEIKLPVKI